MPRSANISLVPPQALDVERTVLGSMIIDSEIAGMGVTKLDEEAFYLHANRLLFGVIKKMFLAETPIDLNTITITCEDLKILEAIGEESYLMEIAECTCAKDNFFYYVKILKSKQAGRQILDLAGKLTTGIATEESVQALLESTSTSLDIIQQTYFLLNSNKTEFSWTFPIEKTTPDIEFRETGILWKEGIGLLTGPSGKGKTNILLAAAVSALNKECDSLGFRINCERVLYVDTENQKMIFHRNVRRALCNRAKFEEGAELGEVKFVNIREQETFKQKQDWLWETIKSEEFECIIIDGIGDMILDVNDTDTCIPFVSKLSAMVSRHHCSVFLTLHGNPLGQATEKARGVLGSELLRKCDCSVLLKAEKKSRSITTDFSLGKNRADRDKLTQYFEWDDMLEMHVSCEPPKKEDNPYDGEKMEEMHDDVLEFIRKKGRRKHKELQDFLTETYDISSRTAQRRITEMIDREYIYKFHGFYFDEKTEISTEEFFKPITEFIQRNEKVSKKELMSKIMSEFEVTRNPASQLLQEIVEEGLIFNVNNDYRVNEQSTEKKEEL